jgi:hypothetical protein
MLMPTGYGQPEAEYWRLIDGSGAPCKDRFRVL